MTGLDLTLRAPIGAAIGLDRTTKTLIAFSAGIIAIALVRLYFALNLIPMPAGDSIFFLEPIYNYCHNGRLLSHLLPIDPRGLDRFVWHGPLPPLLYDFIAPSCSLRTLFVIRWLAFLPVPIALFVLASRGLISPLAYLAVSLFCLAASEKVQFRPESLTIPLVVLACTFATLKRPMSEALCATCAFLCSPVNGALYGIVRVLLLGFPRIADFKWIVAGVVPVTVLVFWLYPFPFPDWIAGIHAQAATYSARGAQHLNHDTTSYLHEFFTYYVRSDFLPLWSVSLLLLTIAISARRWRYLLLLPFIWYFGVRVPATFYTVVPATVATMLLGYPLLSNSWRTASAIAFLLSAVAGLAQLTLRDAISLSAYPDGIEKSHSVMARLVQEHADIVAAPSFSVFTDPELIRVAGRDLAVTKQMISKRKATLIMTELTLHGGGCPRGTAERRDLGRETKLPLFNSPSAWALRVCVTP